MCSLPVSRLLVISMSFLLISACGVAHVNTTNQSEGMNNYLFVYIRKVEVYSKEANAQTNEPLQQKLRDWQAFSRAELARYVNESVYQLVQDPSQANGPLLVADLDVNVTYGNRALRWAVGFGAGQGGVDSVLTVIDAATGQVKFRAEADSDLSGGGAGGDMDDVLRQNIKKLIDQYRLAVQAS